MLVLPKSRQSKITPVQTYQVYLSQHFYVMVRDTLKIDNHEKIMQNQNLVFRAVIKLLASIYECKFELLSHPSNSPHLAPSDYMYYLFKNMHGTTS